ncbi:hypothetical protein ACVWZ3_005630 [Bradyrhizobium sp. i1.3.6]
MKRIEAACWGGAAFRFLQFSKNTNPIETTEGFSDIARWPQSA